MFRNIYGRASTLHLPLKRWDPKDPKANTTRGKLQAQVVAHVDIEVRRFVLAQKKFNCCINAQCCNSSSRRLCGLCPLRYSSTNKVTKFDFIVDEGKGGLNPSRDKNLRHGMCGLFTVVTPAGASLPMYRERYSYANSIWMTTTITTTLFVQPHSLQRETTSYHILLQFDRPRPKQ